MGSTPFTGSIVGSWLFIRSSQPPISARVMHHFTEIGKCYYEMDHEDGRLLCPGPYRFEGNTLTMIYSSGTEQDFELTLEEDGSVCVPSPNGILWWMVRLSEPETYSRAFVDEHGQLQKIAGK